MKTVVVLSFSLFRALQERPEALNALTDVLWIISEAILGAFGESGQPILASIQPPQRSGSLL